MSNIFDHTYFIVFIVYTAILFLVAFFTSRKATNETYFTGNRKSPWYLVAYGMIGTSLSGVTFISVPGWVGSSGFSYMLVVLGYVVGYLVIIALLLPVYYKLKLTSIYSYLDERFGRSAYKTGASFFLLSRFIGAAFRMFIVVEILQVFVLKQWNVPFYLVVLMFVGLILLYSFKGGIRTIVFTDTLQTTFMLLAVVFTIYFIKTDLNVDFKQIFQIVRESEFSKMVYTDVSSKHHYLKQFFSGIFIAIVMTGLDQDMMQKNLTCRSLKDAQKNVFSLSIILVFVNFVFLTLGVLLFHYVNHLGIEMPAKTDYLFPNIALNYLGPVAASLFIIGLISAAYSSADSAITALTTSFTVDILNIKKWKRSDEYKKKVRIISHFSISFILVILMIAFNSINDDAVISSIFTIAGYTYGPLLGFFAFGILSKKQTIDKYLPIVGISSPILSYIIKEISYTSFGYSFGFELLILNGALTAFLMLLLSYKQPKNKINQDLNEKFQIQSNRESI
ncbi:MAG: sodium:solute symporter [Hyphomicrobiales bacterium]